MMSAREGLDALRQQAAACTRCPLYQDATQTVFGAGRPNAPLMLVGEQPGDREDLAGQPFVGPAGQLLDRALHRAQIAEDLVYRTNVVKHFKFERRGQRRIHQRRSAQEVRACRPWLDAEVALVRPQVIVLLGATAAQAAMGLSFRVSRQRGVLLDWQGRTVMATVHPSAVLRAIHRTKDAAAADEHGDAEFNALASDLEVAAEALRTG